MRPSLPTRQVSVVVPTRNRPAAVLAAVESVFAQTYPVHEVIVVIDGPEEGAQTSLQLAELPEPRLRVITLVTPAGGGEARNVGVRSATGDWIAFLDDDDLWMPQKLAKQFASLEQIERGPAQGVLRVLSCPVLARSPERDTVWPRVPYRTGQCIAEYLFCRKGWGYGEALLQTSTLLMPRELMLRVPFTAGLEKHQDWDWLLRATEDRSVQVYAVETAPLVVFHVEGDRPSVSRKRDWRMSLRWAKARPASFTPRALSSFLATECAAQAQSEPWTERVAVLGSFLASGDPRWPDLARLIVFLIVPQGARRWVRERVRKEEPAQSFGALTRQLR